MNNNSRIRRISHLVEALKIEFSELQEEGKLTQVNATRSVRALADMEQCAYELSMTNRKDDGGKVPECPHNIFMWSIEQGCEVCIGCGALKAV